LKLFNKKKEENFLETNKNRTRAEAWFGKKTDVAKLVWQLHLLKARPWTRVDV
jgi:hypothetical protein